LTSTPRRDFEAAAGRRERLVRTLGTMRSASKTTTKTFVATKGGTTL
jgi:hypothetical protein